MIVRLILLHLRWFLLFAFVGTLTTVLSHLFDGGAAAMQFSKIWSGLTSIIGLCGALAVLVPWGMFIVDPRRPQPISVDGFAEYWKLR